MRFFLSFLKSLAFMAMFAVGVVSTATGVLLGVSLVENGHPFLGGILGLLSLSALPALVVTVVFETDR